MVLQDQYLRQKRTRRPDGRGRLRHAHRVRNIPMNAPFKHLNEPATGFVRRHIGPSPRDINAMLETVGAQSLGALMSETMPSSIRQKTPLDLGRGLSETEALAHMG